MKAVADLRRRKLQSAVIALIVLLSSGAGTMALSLLIQTDAPFEHAFDQQGGAHLVAVFDPAQVSVSQLQATTRLSTIAAASGPWRQVKVMLQSTDGGLGEDTLIGREGPGGPVDRLTMVSGRWAQTPGEVVLERHLSDEQNIHVGDALTAINAPGKPRLTVVGVAVSLGRAEGWVLPSGVDPLVATDQSSSQPGSIKSGPQAANGSPIQYLMAYRLHRASQPADIEAAAAQIDRAVPDGAVLGTGSWLDIKSSADTLNNVMVPFLLAFSIVALVASALVIANVITGVVIADYREIGIMKSVGFSPGQVAVMLVAETVAPAVVGCLLGLPLGILASRPFVDASAHAFGIPPPSAWSPMVVGAVVALVLLSAVLSALIPARRAATLSTVRAIASGTAPHNLRARQFTGFLTGLSLPTPIVLGIIGAFVRPVRASITVIAILFGVATVTFAVALHGSLGLVQQAVTRSDAVQVEIVSGPQSDLNAQDVASALAARNETANVVASLRTPIVVSGVTEPVFLQGFKGHSSGLGFAVIHGNWFARPAEVVVSSAFLSTSHSRIGDMIHVSSGAISVPVRIVGSYVTDAGGAFFLLTDWTTVLQIDAAARPDTWEVQLRPGSDARAYSDAMSNQLAPLGLTAEPVAGRGADESLLLINIVTAALALVLGLIAIAGVFNTVLLDTQEKVHELAILKAIGMTPRQVLTMVVTTVLLFGVVGGVAGIPVGLAIHHQIVGQMAAIAGTELPAQFYDVLGVIALTILAGSGLVIALAGAILPASWAARTRVSAVLHAE